MMVDSTTLSDLAIVTTGAVRAPQAPRSLHLLLESADTLPTLAEGGHLTDETVVFVPATDEPPVAGPHRAVEYRGALGGPADQLWLDESFVMEVQAYAVGRFLSVHGPMLLRITGLEDLCSLADDATLARDTGRLPRVAASPMVHLADTTALGWPGASHRARRLHVHTDGSLALSPTGSPLGHLTRLRAGGLAWLGAADPRSAVEAVVGPEEVERVHRQTPWLVRHLAVVAAVRSARGLGVDILGVSGFGSRIDDRIALDDGRSDPGRPVILLGNDSAHVVDPASGRVVPLDLDRAAALERHLDGAGDLVGERLARALTGKGFAAATERAA
jgi:hypothetical protein